MKVDGSDATKRISQMIMKSKFKSQIRCIFLNGITVGGFNVIDILKLSKLTKVPVIAVTRRFPDLELIYRTLQALKMRGKVRLIDRLPAPVKVGNVFVQHIGVSLERAKDFLKLTTVNADVPEPLRIAHIIAAGIVKGESSGRA